MDKYTVKLLKKEKSGRKNLNLYRVFIKGNETKNIDNMEMMSIHDIKYIYEQFANKFNDVRMIHGRNVYRMSALYSEGEIVDYNDEYSTHKVDDGYDMEKFGKFFYANIYVFDG